VSASSEFVNPVMVPDTLLVNDSGTRWYAIRTRSRHEKVAARELDARGVPVFLPLMASLRQWSDRRTEVELPLFPGYVFVRVAYFSDRIRVLQTTGVVSFVGGSAGVSIADEEINAIRTVIARKVAIENHPFLRIGQRVRVRSGSLSGVEGILTAVNGARSLVISVEPIQRSLRINLDGYDVEAA
jgi:transcription antitermination factor NusG